MSNTSKLLIAAFLIFAIAAAFVTPFALIWAFATLSQHEPVYTRWTWLAAFVVMACLGRGGSMKKSG